MKYKFLREINCNDVGAVSFYEEQARKNEIKLEYSSDKYTIKVYRKVLDGKDLKKATQELGKSIKKMDKLINKIK